MSQAEPESAMHIALSPKHSSMPDDNAEAALDNTPPPMSQAEPESAMHITLSPKHSSMPDDNTEQASNDVLSHQKGSFGPGNYFKLSSNNSLERVIKSKCSTRPTDLDISSIWFIENRNLHFTTTNLHGMTIAVRERAMKYFHLDVFFTVNPMFLDSFT
eukprot:5080662-Ditylum_brightwellii.AAC.1